MTLGTVVVGAGQSGLNVAIRLRALGYDKPITLIGEEAHLPYQRPPLSKKFLAGELDAKSLLLRPADLPGPAHRPENRDAWHGHRYP